MKHLVTMAEGRGATATNPKMVPRQHIGSGSSWRYRRKRELCGCVEHAIDGGVLPVTGFPRFDGMARKRVTACDEQVGHGANASNSNNTCFRSTDVVSGYTFEA